jgi:hypothetical protein
MKEARSQNILAMSNLAPWYWLHNIDSRRQDFRFEGKDLVERWGDKRGPVMLEYR